MLIIRRSNNLIYQKINLLKVRSCIKAAIFPLQFIKNYQL